MKLLNHNQGGAVLYDENSSFPNTYPGHASDACWHYQGYDPPLALGLYKITLKQTNPQSVQQEFYFDWRTSDLPPGPGEWDDQRFVYDMDDNKINGYHYPYTQITNGELLTIWEEIEDIEPATSGLEDYWDTCLVVIPNADNHPRIVWGPYPSEIGIF